MNPPAPFTRRIERDRDLSRSPEIELLDPVVVEALRRKTPTERVAMVFEAERTMRRLLEAHLAWQHPDWDQRQITEEIARRWIRGSA